MHLRLNAHVLPSCGHNRNMIGTLLCSFVSLFEHLPLPRFITGLIQDAVSLTLHLTGSKQRHSCKEEHMPKQEDAAATSPLHISWPGFGILFFWQLGILKYLTQNFSLSQLQLVGSSAGGLLCILAACDVDPHAAVQHAHDLCIRTGVFDRPWGLAGVWGGLVRTWLEELLPGDAAERCSGRVTVVVTELPWLATRSISSFDSREDLIDIALASAHVPLFLDGRIAAQCRGRWCIDGSFCYILFRRTMGLIPTGAKVLLFDPWSDKGLRSSWSWAQCLELLGLPGAMWLLDCGHAHAEALHKAGMLNELPLTLSEPDAAVVISEKTIEGSGGGRLETGADGVSGLEGSGGFVNAGQLTQDTVAGAAGGVWAKQWLHEAAEETP